MSVDSYHTASTVPAEGAPLVFALHGTGGNENQFFGLAQEMIPGAGVIAPRGDVSEMGAARFFRRTGEGVYDLVDLARATEKMAGFVEAWKAKFPERDTYAFGYSNGANILASVMMAHPALFDRVGLLHPLVPWAPEPAPGLANTHVLISAGRNDPICPWPLTEQLAVWTRDQVASLSTHYHDGGHELRREEVIALVEFLQSRNAADAA